MQNFTDIPSTRTLSDSLAEILNNDKTAISLSSATAFPTTNLQLGMPCYRSDEQKLYILTQVSPSAIWKLWMDFTGSEGKAPNAEAVDGVDSSTIVQQSRQIIAGTGLSGGGDLSANRTLSLAAGAAAANLGYTPVNKAGDTITGQVGIGGSPISQSLLTVVGSSISVIGNDGNFNLGGARAVFDYASGLSVARFGSAGASIGTQIISGLGQTAIDIDASQRVKIPQQPFISAASVQFDSSGYAINYNTSTFTVSGRTYRHVNVGNNFNYSNGAFTAPVAGDYFVSATWGQDSGSVNRNIGHMWINGVFQGEVCESYGQYDDQTFAAIIRLQAGDYIQFGKNTGFSYNRLGICIRMIG